MKKGLRTRFLGKLAHYRTGFVLDRSRNTNHCRIFAWSYVSIRILWVGRYGLSPAAYLWSITSQARIFSVVRRQSLR